MAKYENKWIALSSDRKKVLASASDVKKLDKKVKDSKLKDVIYHFVVSSKISLVP